MSSSLMHYLRTRNDPQQLGEGRRPRYMFLVDKQIRHVGGPCDAEGCKKSSTGTFQSIGAIGSPHHNKKYNVSVCADHQTDKAVSDATHRKHGNLKEETLAESSCRMCSKGEAVTRGVCSSCLPKYKAQQKAKVNPAGSKVGGKAGIFPSANDALKEDVEVLDEMAAKTNGLNNTRAVHNLMGWDKSPYIDATTPGGQLHHRIHVGDWDESKQKKTADHIKKHLNIDVKFRKRGGYGHLRGGSDMLIPAYHGTDAPNDYKKLKEDVEGLDEEIIGKPGTYEHFAHLATKMIHHGDRGAAADERRVGAGDPDWKIAEKHENHIMKHYGEAGAHVVQNMLATKKDIPSSWAYIQKNKTIKEETTMSKSLLEDLRGGLLVEAKKPMNKHVQTINKKSWNVGCAECGYADEHRQDAQPKSCPQCGNHDIDTQLKEDVEQLDELSKKTLGGYIRKATSDLRNKDRDVAYDDGYRQGDVDNQEYGMLEPRGKNMTRAADKADKREEGINRAAKKLSKEETDYMPRDPLLSYLRTTPVVSEATIAAAEIDELLEDYAALLEELRSIDENINRRLIIRKSEGLGTTDERDAAVQKQYEKLKTVAPKTPEEWDAYQRKLSRNLRAQRGRVQKSDASKADELARARLGGKKSILDLSSFQPDRSLDQLDEAARPMNSIVVIGKDDNWSVMHKKKGQLAHRNISTGHPSQAAAETAAATFAKTCKGRCAITVHQG